MERIEIGTPCCAIVGIANNLIPCKPFHFYNNKYYCKTYSGNVCRISRDKLTSEISETCRETAEKIQIITLENPYLYRNEFAAMNFPVNLSRKQKDRLHDYMVIEHMKNLNMVKHENKTQIC